MSAEQINELYDISKRLKESRDERVSTKAVISKNPSSSMRQRESNAKEEYVKALNDFDYFVKNYVKFNKKNNE